MIHTHNAQTQIPRTASAQWLAAGSRIAKSSQKKKIFKVDPTSVSWSAAMVIFFLLDDRDLEVPQVQ